MAECHCFAVESVTKRQQDFVHGVSILSENWKWQIYANTRSPTKKRLMEILRKDLFSSQLWRREQSSCFRSITDLKCNSICRILLFHLIVPCAGLEPSFKFLNCTFISVDAMTTHLSNVNIVCNFILALMVIPPTNQWLQRGWLDVGDVTA